MSAISVAPDPSLTARFLRTMLDYAPEELFFHLFCLNSEDDKTTGWFQVGRLEQAAEKVSFLCEKWRNVWFSTGLYERPLERGQRGKSEHVVGIPGLRIDLDILSPAHKRTDLPPTQDEALRVLRSFELPPTWIIHSGYGLQAFWQFKEPWTWLKPEGGPDPKEQEEASALMRAFTGTMQELSRRAGYPGGVDPTGDLARVLRLPGTLNRKLDEARPVTVLEFSERFYNSSDFEPYLLADETQPSRPTLIGARKQEGEPAPAEPVLDGCAWARHCITDAASLPEPEWKAQADLFARLENGEELFIETSRPYPGYSEQEAREKFILAVHCSPGPPTCRRIRNQLGGEPFCRQCSQWGDTKDPKIKSPIVLGRPKSRWITGLGANGKQVDGVSTPPSRTPEAIFADAQAAAGSARIDLLKELAQAVAAEPLLVDHWGSEVAKEKWITKGAFLKQIETLKETTPDPSTDEDEIGLVKQLADAILETDHFARDAGGRLFVYQGGVYRADGDKFICRRVKDLLNDWQRTAAWSSHRANEVCEYIRVDRGELWDRPPIDRVNVLNGILDVNTRELAPHSPDFLSPIQIPVKYDPTAKCPHWDEFVRTTFPDDAAEVPFEIAAWLMTPNTSIQKAVLATGEGSNGKSVWLDALQTFIGRQNVVNLSLQRLSEDRFAVARIMGKLANICPDIPSTHLADTSIFKAITGGDRIPAEYKFRDGFDFIPYSRLIFSANHPPRSADASFAFFRRWLVIPFNRTFEEGAEETLTREELDRRLSDPKELSGVLNRALELMERVRTHGITETPSMVAAWGEFRQSTDPLSVWLDRHLIEGSNCQVGKKELHLAYGRACEAMGRPTPSQNAFGRALKKLRPNIEDAQRVIAGKLEWAWVGVGLLTEGTRSVDQTGSHHSRNSRDYPLSV